MAKPQSFREESFYTGSEKDRGFSPSRAADTSGILREQMSEYSRQIDNLRSQQAVQNQAELNKRVQTYKALGTIAPKFLEAAEMLGQSWLSHQRVEANHRTRKLGEAANFVPTPQQAADAQELDEAERAAIQLAPVLDEAKKGGAMPEGIQALKALSGADAVAGPRNYAHNRGTSYEQNLLQFLQNSDIPLRKPEELGGGFFTPNEIDDNSVLGKIAVEAFSKMYDLDTGVEYLSDGVLRPYNEIISKVNSKVIGVLEERERVNKGIADVSQHTETFLRNKDINLLISNITGTYSGEKGTRGFAEATELIFNELLPSLIYTEKLTEPELKAALQQKSSAEFAKGQTHEIFHRNRLGGPNGLYRKINEKLDYDYKERQKERTRIIEADKEDFFGSLEKFREQGIVLSKKDTDERRRNVMKATGINDPSAFAYYDDYTTREEVAEKDAKEKLDYLRSVNGRGFLIEADLEGMPQSVVTAYSPMVREDAEYAKFASSYDVRAKARVGSLTDEIWKENVGRDEKNTRWNKSYDAMYADYLLERQKNLGALGVENHADANERALRTVEDRAKNGVYTTPKGLRDHSEAVEQIITLRRKRDEGVDIYNNPDLWSDKVIQQLQDFHNGKTDSYGPIFDTLSLGRNGETGWDGANKLFRAIAPGVTLKKTVKQEAIESYGPAVQRFIRGHGATRNRMARGQTMDDPNSSFNPRPATFAPIPKENFTRETPSSGSYQPGFDMWDPAKTPRSPFSGIVKEVFTTQDTGYGNYGNGVIIEITHPELGKADMLISHLATRTPLKEGQRIGSGQIVGTQGGTGRVVSIDGTISSYDFLEVAPRGSKSMKPPQNLELWINYAMQYLQGGG